MKYALIDTFLGWLARPILLWNLNDICTVVLEIIVIKTWFSTIKEMLKSRRRIDMLKIRDDVDLKELEKFGFKKKKYDNVKHYVLEKEDKNQDMVFDTENRQLCFCN